MTRAYHVQHDIQPLHNGLILPDHRKHRELGFQFMNKSPKIIPPSGTLKDVAYSILEPSPLLKNNDLDVTDNGDSFTNTNTNNQFNSIENNYDQPNHNLPYKNSQIMVNSGTTVISPNKQQKYFSKNDHLMQGVLTQQRRFSRIISSN